MELGTLYIFHTDFFIKRDTSQDFINSIYKDLKSFSDEDLKFQLLGKATLIDKLCKNVKDKVSLARLRVAQSNILNHAALAFDKKELCNLALEKINSINENDKNEWDSGLEYGFYFVKGNINLFRYEFISDDSQYGYTLNDLNYIMRAKHCYTYLFESYLKGNILMEGINTKSLIVNYSRVLGILSRYVEPFYYLDKLINKHSGYNGDVKLAKVLMLDSIKDKTCDSYSPVLLLRIDRDIRMIRKDKKFQGYDKNSLNELYKEIRNDFSRYKELHGLGRNAIANISKELDKKSKKIKGYKGFVIHNKLGLNQHGLYCHCDKGVMDNLLIKSGHKHTHVDWVNRFEVLIESIKVDFDSARRKFYDSNNYAKTRNHDSVLVENQEYKNQGVLLDKSSIDIKEAFNKCLSILDSIANTYNAAHELMPLEERKNIDFATYFKRNAVKKYIEKLEGNLFSGALYSISYEFHSEEKTSMFKKLKKWRNAFEHDSLLLTTENADLKKLASQYPEVRAFARKKEFKNKTMFLMQLTRSAIFSLVWDLRKLTKSK